VNARQGKEVVLEVYNEIGVLHQIAKLIAEKGVNIVAVHGSVDGRNAVIRMVTDDNLRAVDALRAHDYAPMEKDVVILEVLHKPGMLSALTGKLGEAGLDIHHIYAAAASGGSKCMVVLSCANNDQAVVKLNG
jgi:hypothetical protein